MCFGIHSSVHTALPFKNAAVDIFFSKEKLSMSCKKWIEEKSKADAGNEPLNALIVQAIIAKCKHLNCYFFHCIVQILL